MVSCTLQGEARSYPPPQQLGRNGSQGDSQGQGQARSYPPPQQLGGPGGQGQGQARSYPPPQQLGGPGGQGQGESNRGGPGQTSGQDRRPSTPGPYRPPSSGETLAALLTTDTVREASMQRRARAGSPRHVRPLHPSSLFPLIQVLISNVMPAVTDGAVRAAIAR